MLLLFHIIYMENFVVSARKYRPETFDTVVGQTAITSTLKNAMANGHLAQSFLFCGPRGVGKTTCARIFAKIINCQHPTENMEACGLCESCLGAKNSASYNIYELDAASNNGVDEMRNLINQVRIPPQIGKYKVYVIDEVHMLSTAAFNAFLKTLEEPPAHAKFILATTEKNKILPTILSRCQIFDFKRIKIEDIANHLAEIAQKEGIQAEADALHLIAQKADGGLRDALSMFDQIVSFSGNTLTYKRVLEMLNVLDYDYYFQMLDYLLKADIPAALNLYNQIMENGFDGQYFISGLGNHLRSLLVMQDASTLALLEVGENIKSKYAIQAQQASLAFLIKALELTNTCDINYKMSNNKRLSIEILLLQLCAIGQTSIQMQTNPSPQQRGNAISSVSTATTPTSLGNSVSPSEGSTAKVASTIVERSQNSDSTVSSPSSEAPSIPNDAKPTHTAASATAPSSPATSATVPNTAAAPTVPNRAQRSSAFSMKDMLADPNSIENEELKKKTINHSFTTADFDKQWSLYLSQVEHLHPNLHGILQNSLVRVEEDTHIIIKTANEFQNKEILEIRSDILEYLRQQLQNSEISLDTEIDAQIVDKKVYTPQDKLAKMANINPEIINFKKELSLDLDF